MILSYRSFSFKQKLMMLTRTKRRCRRILEPSSSGRVTPSVINLVLSNEAPVSGRGCARKGISENPLLIAELQFQQ